MGITFVVTSVQIWVSDEIYIFILPIVFRVFKSLIFKFIVVDEGKKTEIYRKPVSLEFNVCLVATAKGDFQRSLKCVCTSSFHEIFISLVIRQKGESQNGCYKKTKHAKFSEKQTFLTP